MVTKRLIRIYQDYIFRIDITKEEDVSYVKQLDSVLNKYIDDYLFRKEMQKQILTIKIKKDAKDVLKEIIKSIINIFNNYLEYTTRVIYISRWI